MNQPELGKKVAELRKAKGLTQEELVSKCNVTVRTLQRIESGVVTPRSYTIRTIFTALDYNIYSLSESNSEKRIFTFFRNKMERLYKCVIDLFNLKTNTMKKISILSTAAIVLIFGFFILSSESNAQKSEEIKFITMNGRGIVYLFPLEFRTGGHVSNVKDTADYKFGKNLIQEYKFKIFLNKKFVGKVLEGDTVVVKNGKIAFRKFYEEITSSTGKGIIYLYPKNQPITEIAVTRDTENLYCNDYHIKEYENKIFLNDVYVGTAKSGDTVIYKRGILSIMKTY